MSWFRATYYFCCLKKLSLSPYFFIFFLFRSYDPAGVKNELSRIELPDSKGTKMAEGLKVVKEQIFDRTTRDWVYKVVTVS